uniref:Uncharacterized protein n=1 Tax=Siphoviridae sp. ct6tD39 TaxID=2826301 RepID=A0A8S5NBU1_9CAUD|nr:MAG TPA: hypothetical protein [Siphoviridae sp. ct6tD39]
MNKIFSKSEEKYVKNVVIYGKSGDNYVYEDSACTKKLDKATVSRLFLTGLLVNYGGATYTVTALKDNTTKKCVDLTFWDALASTAAAVTLHSSEYKA